MTRKKLYIIEKIWDCTYLASLKQAKLDDTTLSSVLIRPCNVSYMTYVKFATGKYNGNVIHEGAVHYWYANGSLCRPAYASSFKTLEEFLIDLNVTKQIFPAIENHLINIDWKTYIVKTIDLKTGKTLYDAVDKFVEKYPKLNDKAGNPLI